MCVGGGSCRDGVWVGGDSYSRGSVGGVDLIVMGLGVVVIGAMGLGGVADRVDMGVGWRWWFL